MTAFARNENNGVVLWAGAPACQQGHDSILRWLQEHGALFISTTSEFSERIKGNLGETISFCIGAWFDFSDFIPFPANAFTAINDISKSDLDIVWLYFGKAETDDLAVVQEVKTTGDLSLNYADKLIPDYDKLFAVHPAFRLQSRLQAIKNEVEYKLKRPELCKRIDCLAGMSPQTSPRVRLVPTLVHDLNAPKPVQKMVAIRSTLASRGWPVATIRTWAIAFSDLNARLKRLALGQN